jgi:hypothetical protein
MVTLRELDFAINLKFVAKIADTSSTRWDGITYSLHIQIFNFLNAKVISFT